MPVTLGDVLFGKNGDVNPYQVPALSRSVDSAKIQKSYCIDVFC